MKYPKLRAVDAAPIEQEDERLARLRDPLGFSTKTIALPAILSISKKIEDMVAQLDEAFPLEAPPA